MTPQHQDPASFISASSQHKKANLFLLRLFCAGYMVFILLKPCSYLDPSLFLFLFFLADLVSLVFPSFPSMDVCFDSIYFSIVNFPWVPCSFAFLQASFVLPGAVVRCTLMSTLTAGFGLHWGKEGGSCVETALTGPRERIVGDWSG